MTKSYRKERINGNIKEILSELVLTQLKDPRVGLVTITEVRVAKDMTVAKVFYTVMGEEEERKETHKGLVSARYFMRKVIATELKLRTAPELRFVYDDTLERSMAIEQALRENKPEPDEDESDDDAVDE
jgi:ribosome-binding factor A